ncbi:hypothetical protein CBL_01829 [Carabus blaptoides fortunei]
MTYESCAEYCLREFGVLVFRDPAGLLYRTVPAANYHELELRLNFHALFLPMIILCYLRCHISRQSSGDCMFPIANAVTMSCAAPLTSNPEIKRWHSTPRNTPLTNLLS